MKTRRVVMLSVVVLLVLFSGPLRASTPRVDSADPPQVFVDRDTAVTLTGDGFDVGAGVGLLPGGPFLAGSVGAGWDTYFGGEGESFAYAVEQNYGSWMGFFNSCIVNLNVLDVSDPRAPAIVGGVEFSAFDGRYPGDPEVAAAGDYACVTNGFFLQVIDVSNPRAPILAGSVEIPDPARVRAAAGDCAYVTSGSWLQVIDVSDPQAPAIAGRVYTWGDAQDVAVAGDYAYVTNGSGLLVIDVSDPQAPVLVGGVRTPGDARDVVVAGDYAYVTNTSGLLVIDVSDPQAPVLVGGVRTPGYAWGGVAVAGHYAYVGQTLCLGPPWDWEPCGELRGIGLQVIDVSDPAVPVLVGRVEAAGDSVVGVAGDVAYLLRTEYRSFSALDLYSAWWNGTLHAIDVSAPRSPAGAPNPPLRDVATPTDRTIGLTVPAGFAPGPYHVEVTNPDGAAATLHNGLRACERHALDASLEPILEPAFPALTREPVPWRMTVAGDAAFFEPKVRHEGRLLLPELPATLGIRFEPAGGSGPLAIELHLGWPNGTGEVVLIGDDPGQITALWEAMRSAGGCALPQRDEHAYGDVVLQLSRTPAASPAPSTRPGSALGGVIVPGLAPIRYRYDFAADGRLTAARASGPAVDLIFEAVGRDKYRCETTDTIRYTEALTAACEGFAALHPQLVVDCSR